MSSWLPLERILNTSASSSAAAIAGELFDSVVVLVASTGAETATTDWDGTNLIIAAGSNHADVVISIVDDNNLEPSEDLIVSMGTPVNGIAGTDTQVTATIDVDPSDVAAVTISADTSRGQTCNQCSNSGAG